MDWPVPVDLLAFDHSAEMIAAVWRPPAGRAASVVQAQWQRLPVADRTVDLVIGDGSLNALPTHSVIARVGREVARVLRPDGALVLRAFVRPDIPEPLDAVAAALATDAIGSFHALKWRLAMALSQGPDFSVAVDDIHRAFAALVPDRAALSARTGWPRDTIDAIDAYRGAQTRYTFPTAAALRRALRPEFHLDEHRTAEYELAERCPTLRFLPLAASPSPARAMCRQSDR